MDRPATHGYATFVRALGIDVGERRVGLALSDPTGTLATPLTTLSASTRLEDRVAVVVLEIERLIQEDDGLDSVVIGLPRALDGRPHAQTSRVMAFVEALRARTEVPISLQDERLSSREAESRLALRERDWRQRKQRLDAAAAAVILQDHLDLGRRQETGDSNQESTEL